MTYVHVFYQLAGGVQVLLAMILFSRYVYLEPVLKGRKAWICFFLSYLAVESVLLLTGQVAEDGAAACPLLFFSIYILLVRREHRVRGAFLVVPVLGFLVAAVSLFYAVPYTVSGCTVRAMQKYEYLLDLCFLVLFLLFLWKGKDFREKFQAEVSWRKLGRWERNFLHGTGSFLLAVGVMMTTVGEFLPSGETARIFTGFGSLAAVLLEVSAIALVQQGNKRMYYQYMTDLNAAYLKAELDHFQACREGENKLRGFRHDMKNHFLCMKELAEQGKAEQIASYIRELEGDLEAAEPFLHTGHEIADAIINEKGIRARKQGVALEVDGRFPSDLPVRAADLCALLSNALDNALEAQDGETGGWIGVTIRQQGGFLSIVVENPVGEEGTDLPPGQTAKAEKGDHGFGLLNMICAAKRYHGSVRKKILEEPVDGKRIYRLEILLCF